MEAPVKKYIKVVDNGGIIPVGHIAMAGFDSDIFIIMSKPFLHMTTDRESWILYVEPIPPELFEIN